MMIGFTMFILFLVFNLGNSVILGVMVFFYMLLMLFFNIDYMLDEYFIIIDLGVSWGGDFISFYLIMMLIWLTSVVYLFEWDLGVRFLVSLMILMLFYMFMMMSILGVFLLFESSIIPVFMLILFYGYNFDRYVSGLYMLIYTLMSSLPFLLCLLMVYYSCYNLDFVMGLYYDMYLSWWIKFFLIMVFLVKVPMFFFHIWLPKAHVEAPVFGSMYLAALMLKLGGYGLIRLKFMFFFEIWMVDLVLVISILGILVLSLLCIFQLDLKILVAYSSVIHMAMMLVGLVGGVDIGFYGGIVMMLSHGICSSCLFFMVNDMYMVTGSRLVFMNKGFHIFFPVYSYLWMLSLVNNIGAPPCLSFVGEIYLLISLVSYSDFLGFYLIVSIFFISWFVMVVMYVGCCSGFGLSIVKFDKITILSYIVIFSHLIPSNFIILMVGSFI